MSLNNLQDFLVDLKQFELIDSIDCFHTRVNKVKNKQNGKIYAMKYFKGSTFSHIKHLFSQIIILLYDHPALLHLEAFRYKINEFMIFTKFYQEGDLSQSIDYEKEEPDWLDDTAKMIIMAGICAGLTHLHSHKIILGSLETSNILLNDKHEPIINTSCYYLEKYYQEPIYVRTVVYPKPYQSPEQHEGITNPKSDIYPLGFIFYELCLHSDPFKGTKSTDEIRNGVRPKFPKNFQPNLKQLIEALWSTDPDQRPTAFETFKLLGCKEYFLPNTNIKKYMEYYNRIYQSTKIELPTDEQILYKCTIQTKDSFSQYQLGKYLINKYRRGSLHDKGIEYLELSASKHYGPALYELALEYEKTNNHKSFQLLKESSTQLYIKSLIKLSQYYLYGKGCEQSTSEAESLLYQASIFGSSEAILELSYQYFQGEFFQKDKDKSIQYFKLIRENEISDDPLLHQKYLELKALLNEAIFEKK